MIITIYKPMYYLPISKKPNKLLRIMIVSQNICNYKCNYCCFWNEDSKSNEFNLLRPEDYRFIAETAVESNCNRIMLTGGEPLLIDEDELLPIISAISSVQGIKDFWLTTNGYLLSKESCTRMKSNGLRKIVITIAADTEDKYKQYTNYEKASLLTTLKKVSYAIDAELRTEIHVPLSKNGISSYAELINLIYVLRNIGIRDILIFKLHKTIENASVFNNLYVSPLSIINNFLCSKEWRLVLNENGQKIFTDGEMRVKIPAEISILTQNCVLNKCSHYCQGTYAAYLVSCKKRVFIRACHRDFSNKRNEFEIDINILNENNKKKLLKLFSDVWRYAYEN